MKTLKQSTLLSLACLTLSNTATAVELIQLDQEIDFKLTRVVRGQDPIFGQSVLPAQSIEPQGTAESRVEEITKGFSQELSFVANAFLNAPEDKIEATTQEAVFQFSAETSKEGAARTLEGRGPILSYLRQFAVIKSSPKLGDDPVTSILSLVSAFESTPKPEDYYYHYENSHSLSLGDVTELRSGSSAHYLTHPRPASSADESRSLKKCRKIIVLGWFCNTSIYGWSKLPTSSQAEAGVFINVLIDLEKVGEHAKFKRDARGKNLVDGYTSALLVVRKQDSILIYQTGAQSGGRDPGSFAAQINDGHKLEYRQMMELIRSKL